LVITFTGRNYGTNGSGHPFVLMQNFMLPALENTG
jgi:hypothetical protein